MSTSPIISPLDVAVCDPDLLWRVEHMNALRGVNVRAFASAIDAVEEMTVGHPTVIVLGPTLPIDELTRVTAEDWRPPGLRLVAVARAEGWGWHATVPTGDVEAVVAADATDAEFADAVLGVLASADGPAETVATAATDLLGEPEHDLEHPAAVDAPAPHRALPENLIVVTSAKAGEGASTVALNLALGLAAAAVRVALVDGDPRFGDLALDLGGRVEPPPAIRDLPITDLTHLATEDPSGLLLVQCPPARPGIDGDDDRATQAAILTDVVTLAAGRADVVVADLPIDALLRDRAFLEATVILVVTTGHIASIKNTFRVTSDLDHPRDARLVLNDSSRHHDATPPEAVAEAVGLPLTAHLPYDTQLVRAAATPRRRLVGGAHYRRALAPMCQEFIDRVREQDRTHRGEVRDTPRPPARPVPAESAPADGAADDPDAPEVFELNELSHLSPLADRTDNSALPHLSDLASPSDPG